MSEWPTFLEDELRRELDDSGVDYAAVWEKLCRRMDRADAEGPLALLACHENLPDQAWERIVRALDQRITRHREYDEPVEECVRAHVVQDADGVRRIEQRLEETLDVADRRPTWEQVLAAEQVVSQGRWERIDERLFRRIGSSDVGLACRRRIIVFPLTSVLKAAAVLALAVSGSAIGLRAWRDSLAAVPTYLVQANGANIARAADTHQRSDRYDAGVEGGLEIANRHGFVRLHNGASLVLERATRTTVTYRLRMPPILSPGDPIAKATFFVERSAERKSFTVSTGEYDIRVHGTYFRVSVDMGNRISTEVLEGTVLVNVPALGIVEIRAGQRLAFDETLARYALFGGGPVVERADIPAMPDLSAIGSYRPLTVTANVALADVTIDDAYRGTTPLWVLLPPGPHRVRVQRDGMTALDTTLRVEEAVTLYAALRPRAPLAGHGTLQIADRRVARGVRRPAASGARSADQPATPDSPTAEDELVAAQVLELSDPKAALTAYLALLRRDNVSPMVRQSALFAVGRLQAEHARDHAAARESFMRYLALYPAGAFAREALLRLAELEFTRDQEQSVAYYLRFCELYPTHHRVPELRYRVGLVYQQRGRLVDVAYMFRQALGDIPADEPELRERIRAALHRVLVEQGDRAGVRLVEK